MHLYPVLPFPCLLPACSAKTVTVAGETEFTSCAVRSTAPVPARLVGCSRHLFGVS